VVVCRSVTVRGSLFHHVLILLPVFHVTSIHASHFTVARPVGRGGYLGCTPEKMPVAWAGSPVSAGCKSGVIELIALPQALLAGLRGKNREGEEKEGEE